MVIPHPRDVVPVTSPSQTTDLLSLPEQDALGKAFDHYSRNGARTSIFIPALTPGVM